MAYRLVRAREGKGKRGQPWSLVGSGRTTLNLPPQTEEEVVLGEDLGGVGAGGRRQIAPPGDQEMTLTACHGGHIDLQGTDIEDFAATPKPGEIGGVDGKAMAEMELGGPQVGGCCGDDLDKMREKSGSIPDTRSSSLVDGLKNNGLLAKMAADRQMTLRPHRLPAGGETLLLPDDINWNGEPKDRRGYITYMSKNLFRFFCPVASEFGYESKDTCAWVYLNPVGYDSSRAGISDTTLKDGRQLVDFYTNDNESFWTTP